MSSLLTLRDVDVSPEVGVPPVLRSLMLNVEQGERVGILGLNGAGKTTLLHAIAGLAPHSGEIVIDGVPVSPSNLAEVRRKVGFLFSSPEDQILFPRVEDDVAFALRQRGMGRPEALAAARRQLGMLRAEHLAERAPHELSQGERLAVALAGILVADPPLLLLDEPSSSLDPPARRNLASRLASRTTAMLIASHDLPFLRRCATRFLVLQAGRIVQDCATPDALEGEWEG